MVHRFRNDSAQKKTKQSKNGIDEPAIINFKRSEARYGNAISHGISRVLGPCVCDQGTHAAQPMKHLQLAQKKDAIAWEMPSHLRRAFCVRGAHLLWQII